MSFEIAGGMIGVLGHIAPKAVVKDGKARAWPYWEKCDNWPQWQLSTSSNQGRKRAIAVQPRNGGTQHFLACRWLAILIKSFATVRPFAFPLFDSWKVRWTIWGAFALHVSFLLEIFLPDTFECFGSFAVVAQRLGVDLKSERRCA